MENAFNKLLVFLGELKRQGIDYSLAHHREDAIMVMSAAPGERWEIEFCVDGSVEVEKFISNGEIYDAEVLNEFLVRFREIIPGERSKKIDADAIIRIERTFDCTLPKDYKRLLLGFPDSLARMLSTEPNGRCRRIFTDTKTIIAENKFVRDPVQRAHPNFFDYAGKYFLIGGDIGGNLYCLNCKHKRSNVYFWFHEDGEFELYAKTIQEFIRRVFESKGHLAVDELNFVHLE